MKFLLALGVTLLSFSSSAFVSECEQSTKLLCNVSYYSLKNNERVTETATRLSQFELKNWDEPSLSYCEAEVAFNKNGLYINATYNADSILNIRIVRSKTSDNLPQDYFSTSTAISENKDFNASLSLTPKLPSGVYGLDVNCKIQK